jgi:hypothetical protein
VFTSVNYAVISYVQIVHNLREKMLYTTGDTSILAYMLGMALNAIDAKNPLLLYYFAQIVIIRAVIIVCHLLIQLFAISQIFRLGSSTIDVAIVIKNL